MLMRVEWPSELLTNKVQEGMGPAPGTSIQLRVRHYYYYTFQNREQKQQTSRTVQFSSSSRLSFVHFVQGRSGFISAYLQKAIFCFLPYLCDLCMEDKMASRRRGQERREQNPLLVRIFQRMWVGDVISDC